MASRFVQLIVLVVTGVMILAGTALTWSVEDELLDRTVSGDKRHEKNRFRYAQLLFWFAWFAALCEVIKPNATFTSIQAALIFVIVARRAGDGFASFEQTDMCRITAETISGDDKADFQRCAAGGVLSYFGLIVTWIISLPRVHTAHLQSWEGIVLILSALTAIVGAIVLWTSKYMEFGFATRYYFFDTTMYAVFAIVFGVSSFLCDMVSVLGSIAFYLTWVAASQFSVMFFVQRGLDTLDAKQGDKNSVWAGYVLIWMGVMGMLFMVASRLLTASAGDAIIHDDNSADAKRASHEDEA